MTAPELPPLPPADHSFEMGDTFTADQLREYAMLERLAERERRKVFERKMDSQPCSACDHEKHPEWPITDDLASCSLCDWTGSGSRLHSCKTGWRHLVCDSCNSHGTPLMEIAAAIRSQGG